MNTHLFESFVNHPLVVSVGWMLVHFVWQATLAAVIVALILAILRKQSAGMRYNVACTGLAVMTIMPITTLVWLIAETDPANWKAEAAPAPQSMAMTNFDPARENSVAQSDAPSDQHVVVQGAPEIATTAEVNWSDRLESASRSFQGCLPWCVLAWIAGVVCLAMRLLIGLSRIWRWRRDACAIFEGRLNDAVQRLTGRMNMNQSVRLLESARATVPAVIGWLRPTILVPVSMLSGLTTAELESILAHELAHIRRHDFLVNLLQSVVETVLFYHPAVWWLSHQIRAERENCCDDIAVKVCGDRVVFARALARMEEIRCGGERLAVAANGGSLLGRIRRITGREPVCSGPWWPAGAFVLGSLGLLLSGIWITAAMAEPALVAVQEKADDDAAVSIVEPDNEDNKDKEEIRKRKSELIKTDSKTGTDKRVFSGIELTSVFVNKTRLVETDMMYSNLFMYSFIPARIAKELGAIELGEIDFGAAPPNREQPFQVIDILDSGDRDIASKKPDVSPTLQVHEVMTVPKEGVTVVPYPDDVIWIPGHLGFYGMNQTQQHVFKIVRIEKVDLGVGPAFGPVNALVLDDANSDFGVLGSNWAQQVRGENGEGLWFEAATGSFHFMVSPFEKKQDEPPSNQQPQGKPERDDALAKDDNSKLDFRIVEKDGDRVSKMTVGAIGHGRSAVELVRNFSMIDHDISRFRQGVSVTNMETIVSAVKPNYVFVNVSEAAEVLFNLPEGSGMRAEFSGENIEMTTRDHGATVVVTGGKVDLIDAVGVIRAWASPDGGAEQLVIDCKESNSEVVLSMRTRRLKADADYPNPPVQFVVNIETGASADEQDPPHRGIRYEIQSNLESDDGNEKFVRLKMKWRYDMKRLAEEAENESGLSLEELIFGQVDQEPDKSSGPLAVGITEGWGELAWKTGLRSRLTMQTRRPKIGEPLLFQLEVKNFGDQPTEIDPQRYAPFRVLKVQNDDFSTAARFIGLTPQTAGGTITLQPGESKVLWNKVDASELFLLNEDQDYFIFAEGGDWAMQAFWQDSNRIKVRPGPGELPPLQRVISDLMPLLPEDWKLSTGFGAIYLSHAPTNLKKDVTTIQLVFLGDADTKKLNEAERPPQEVKFGLGKTVLGEAWLIAPADASKLWPDYSDQIEHSVSKIRLAASTTQQEDNDVAPDDDDKPWKVSGTITDVDGKSLIGVTVFAHCGIGTLFNTGSGITDENGHYEFTFGPGIHGGSPKLVQAATISVSMEGFTEKNLHRQGDCIAALEQPDEIDWGEKTTDDLFLPGESKEINFVMVPAAKVKGVVIGPDGDKLDGVRVSLVGEDMPPSSSVAAHARTDKGGRFELTGIPTGFKFQLLIEPAEAKPPWQAWASPPLVFTSRDDGLAHIEYSMHGRPVDFSFQQLFLSLIGSGVNWKTALKEAGTKPLELNWDGLSTETMVSASTAFLELGEKKRD